MAAGTAKITLNTYSFPDGYVTGDGGNVEGGDGVDDGKIAVYYDQLDFTPSSADSYKSTSGDVFKVYVGGVRIYRRDDQDYSSGYDFMEPGDNADGTKLAGLVGYNPATTTGTPTNAVSWNATTNEVWTIDTTNSKILIDIEAIKATNLYGLNGKSVTFATSNTVIELRRAVQELRSPSVDFSNASILTEQDLDNSSKNVFHVAQQASAAVDSAMKFNETTDAFEAYEPGTTTVKKIIGVETGTATNDAVNFGQFTSHDNTIIGYRNTTLEYKEDTEDYKLEAGDWATKVNGVVDTYTNNVAQNDGSEYSAKAYSVGGTGVTGTTNRGSAKDWAIGAGGAIASKPDGSEYSAKEYAQGSTATGGTAKEWAQKDDGAVHSSEYSAKAYANSTDSDEPPTGSAKSWATQDTTAVASSLFSAKEYASGSNATGGTAKDWASKAGSAQVASTDYSAKAWASDDSNNIGSSKDWASKAGSAQVASTDFSSKAYAQDDANDIGSAKDWASKATTVVNSTAFYSAKEYASGDATASGGSAKAWATDTGQPDGQSGSKSAKTWAGEAATSAASADSVSTSNAIVMGIALG